MPVNPDFSDLFSALNAVNARYLTIGGYAFAFHAEPRYTKDIDIWVEPSGANAEAVWRALAAFGAPMSNILPADFAQPGMVVQLGVPPNRIDIVTSIEGVAFDEAWSRRAESRADATPLKTLQLLDKGSPLQSKQPRGGALVVLGAHEGARDHVLLNLRDERRQIHAPFRQLERRLRAFFRSRLEVRRQVGHFDLCA